MSTISSTNSASTNSILNSGSAANSSSATAASGTDALANSQTFLTLLVAQLKNQDPTQPADGLQFVTQLAQFSQLEQSVAIRQDIGTIKDKYAAAPAATSTTATTGA